MSDAESAPGDEPQRDILAAFRERIMRLFAIAGVIFLLPFAVYDLIAGRVALSLSVLAVIAILVIDGLAIQWKKRPPIPFGLLLVPAAACIALSLKQQGFYGALWTYPSLLFSYFVLPRRVANAGSLALGLIAAVMGTVYVGPDITVRFVVTLAMTVVIINIILNIINELQVELTDQAVTDPLTGAYNRRQMDQSLAEAIERKHRTGAPVSLLVIDIDHFKKVNDDFGHHVGDKVLKGLVALIKGRVRKLDRLFRMGGEEFVLLLPDTRANSAMKQAEALRKLVSEAHLLDERPVTVSIGVAEYWAEETQEAWMQAADDALYEAKGAGRNTVVLGSADSESIPGLSEPARRYNRAS